MLPVLLVVAAAASVLLVRRGSDRVRVAVALVVALACLAPGIGLGAGRVVQDTWDLTAVAGCLLLLAGLGLLSVGLAGLRVIPRRAARATARIAALVVIALLVFPAWPAGDVPEETAAASFITTGSPRTVSSWTVPGAGHTRGLATRPRAWERRVVGFLDRALLNR